MSKKILIVIMAIAFTAMSTLSFAATIRVPADQTTIAAAIAAAAADDIINVASGTYAEDITIATRVTIKCSSVDSLVTITGAAGAGNVVSITASGLSVTQQVVLQNIAVDISGNASKLPGTACVNAANAMNFVKMFKCTFKGGATASPGSLVRAVGSANNWQIEDCTFTLNSPNAKGLDFAGTGAGQDVVDFDIIGNSFVGRSDYIQKAVFVSDNIDIFNGFYFGGNTVNKATFQVNYDDDNAAVNIRDLRVYDNVFVEADGMYFMTTDGADAYQVFDGAAAGAALALNGQILIKGNHFGSLNTDGDKYFAVMFHGFLTLNTTEGNIYIQNNNFQFPMTNGVDTATGIDGGANGGQVTAVAAGLNLAGIDATQNYWGQVTGPLTAYEDNGIAAVNTSGAFTYSNWINSYQIPQIDETNRGIEYYDYDNDGHLDRVVIWFDQYVDPATITSYNGWAIEAPYAFDTAKAPKLSLDNDLEGTPDGVFCLTLYLVEQSGYDTGVKPQMLYLKATGAIAGITGNINAKVNDVGAATATEHDKAKPVIKSAITRDNATGGAPSKADNGFLDAVVITFSEAISIVNRTASTDADIENNIALGGLAAGYSLKADGGAISTDTITLAVVEGAGADTGTKPTVTITTDGSDDVADAADNTINTVVFSGTADGASPVAMITETADFGTANTGTGAADGYIDGYTITFSEALKAIAAGDSGAVRSAFTIEKVENTIDLSTALLTTAANVLTVKGRSLKDASAVGHPWDTNATPDLTYTNAGGIMDAANNQWVYFWDTVQAKAVAKNTDVNDKAKPIIARATGQVNSKNLYITFSETAEGNGAAIGGGVLKQKFVAADLQFHNIFNTGTNATAIASLSDDNASDNGIVAVMDETFLVADVVNDSLSIAAVVRDFAGGAASGTGNTMVDVIVTINDVIAPTLLTAVTNDYDNDGWIDTIKLTFSEDINDAGITGYNGTDKISLNAATNWAVAGFTVVGLNFISDGTEQNTATTDATTRGLLGIFDEKAAFNRGVYTSKVINVADVANDNILYLMVKEGSSTDTTFGDTDAVPALTVTGETNAAVGDFKPNYLATVTKTTADKAGAALMAAEFRDANTLRVWLSEAVADSVILASTTNSTPIGDELSTGDFTIHVGIFGNTVSAVGKDVTQVEAGIVDLFFITAITTADNPGWVAITNATSIHDNAGNWNTQNAGLANMVGFKTITAWDGSGSTEPPIGPLTPASGLTIADVPADQGHWFIAEFTPSTDDRVQSYQFYRRSITGTDTTWIYSAIVPKLYVNANGKVKCMVPTAINGSQRWAVVASSGSALSGMAETAKEGEMAVAQLAPAGKLAADVLLSPLSAISNNAGAIDNISPTNISTWTANDNEGAGAGVLVSWTAPVDHGIVGWYGTSTYQFPIYGATKYEVYRRSPSEATFTKVGEAPAGATSFVDNVADGTTMYTYRVKSLDGTFTVQTGNRWAMANANANVADFSSDGVVDFTDFTMFASVYGMTSTQNNWVSLFDLAANNTVDFDDFTAFAANYGFGAEKAAKEIAGVQLPVSNVAFTMDSKVDESASMYYINVNVSDFATLNGFEFKLAYDSSALELVKDSISGLSGLSIQNDKDGIVEIANIFNGEQFNGTVTLGFQSKGVNSNFVFELTNALVADKEFGISQVTNLSKITAKALPTVYTLSKNYPNPFNPTTTIEYAIPSNGKVELVVYNMTGQKVRTLVSENKEAGFFKAVWDGRNDTGETVASGLYFYKLASGKFNKIEKMTLVK